MTAKFQNALFVSIAVHLAILSIFFLVQVHPNLRAPEEVEISFVGSLPPQTVANRTYGAPKPLQSRKTISEENQPVIQKTKTVVALPKRKMQEEEEPLIPVRPEEKVLPREQPLSIPPEKQVASAPANIPGLPQKAVFKGEKGMAAPEAGTQGEQKETPSVIQTGEKGEKHPFKIEGEASRREILSKVLPSYPKGYHAEGIVKLKFTVLPNGLVGDVLPLVKADPVLEKITIDAFQQWRFNPIPSDKPQKIATGVITFRYVLK